MVYGLVTLLVPVSVSVPPPFFVSVPPVWMLALMIVLPAPATVRSPEPVMLGEVAEPLTISLLVPVLLLVHA